MKSLRPKNNLLEEEALMFVRSTDNSTGPQTASWQAPDFERQGGEFEQIWHDLGELETDPELSVLRAEAVSTGRKNPSPKHIAMVTRWAAVCLMAFGVSFWFLKPADIRYTTGIGERLIVKLPDGTKVVLAPNSRLKVMLGLKERNAEVLLGKVFFDVAHDKSRPFSVVAGTQIVRATGTQFSVTFGNRASSVVLVEGSVSVEVKGTKQSNQVFHLTPGEKLEEKVGRPVTINTQTETAWIDGKAIFQDRPLSEVVAAFNDYSGTRMTVVSSELSAERISGAFSYADPESFLKALKQTLPVTVSNQENGEVIINRSAGE